MGKRNHCYCLIHSRSLESKWQAKGLIYQILACRNPENACSFPALSREFARIWAEIWMTPRWNLQNSQYLSLFLFFDSPIPLRFGLPDTSRVCQLAGNLGPNYATWLRHDCAKMSLACLHLYKANIFKYLSLIYYSGSHSATDEVSQFPVLGIPFKSLKNKELSISTALVVGLHLDRARYLSPLCPRAAKSRSCSAWRWPLWLGSTFPPRK